MNLSRREFLRAGIGTTAALGLPLRHTMASPAGILTNVRRGYSMPAEWSPHERCLMQFVPPQSWPRGDYMGAARAWAAVANAVADFEPVTIAVRPKDRALAQRLLSQEIEVLEMPLNDGWSRDSGPTFVVDEIGNRRIQGFAFNGWGDKFLPFDDDAKAKWRFAKAFGWPIDDIPFVLEGGAISVDGEGTLLTTEQCLLHPNRNPTLSKSDQEVILKASLGVEKVIWLGQGIAPDPVTDGHVDGLCVFAGPGTVLLQTTDDQNDENFAITQDARRRLQLASDAKGRPLEIIELPIQDDVLHINFYICNGAVIVPVAGDPRQDDEPIGILREIFPERKVVVVSGAVMAAGGGGVHCITQQVPRVG